MSYFAHTDDQHFAGALGCGPGCQCAPCRGTNPALSETYVDDDDRPAGFAWFAEMPLAVPARRAAAAPTAAPIDLLLPAPGPGYYSYDVRHHQYGRADTIRAIQAIGAAWQRAHPNGPSIGIGDLSLRGGGPTPRHGAHQRGLEVDIRPMRRDGLARPVTYQDPAYSRELTQELVNTIHANPVLRVRVILFNDPMVAGVRAHPGHDNHLHVGFHPASVVAARPLHQSAGTSGLRVSASELAIVRAAIARGERNANRITDSIFYGRHPERRRLPIATTETSLVAEWKAVRDRLVVPELARAFGPGRAGATSAPRPTRRRRRDL